MKPNFLFVMCDQLRWDYLSCYGHPSLQTPHIDSLAAAGVRFDQAYCQAPLCGPSRASFYTGRYVSSHGAVANPDPLRVGELTLGDYLGELGYRTALCGKSHTWTSPQGLARLHVGPSAPLAARLRCGGFEPWEVYEGLYPDSIVPPDLGYNAYLREQGFEMDNPWEAVVNTADSGGSGWAMRNSTRPSRVPEAHSETAFLTRRAQEFMADCGPASNWCLHLSYIKPHWPLMAPAPYHELFAAADVQPPVRSESERLATHPVVAAFMQAEYSRNYADEAMRSRLVPIYMGLIKQIDDQLGRLFDWMRRHGHWDNTVIVFTSDHGDYLGDHWLGEKDLFHEPSVRLPLIICDNRRRQTGGATCGAPVEAIDLVPTLIDMGGGVPPAERLEGSSLCPLLDEPADRPDGWRECVFSEIDYVDRGARRVLDIPPEQCRAWMAKSQRYKFIFYEGFAPQLFDLERDPDELHDVAADSAYAGTARTMERQLFSWLRNLRRRTELPATELPVLGPARDEQLGIIIGRW